MFTTGKKIILNEIIKINVWFFQLLQISFFIMEKQKESIDRTKQIGLCLSEKWV
jgi:hypothetical protein